MVIAGKVDCKVPFAKQLIHLSYLEQILFEKQYKNDILSFEEASDLNSYIQKKLVELPNNNFKGHH